MRPPLWLDRAERRIGNGRRGSDAQLVLSEHGTRPQAPGRYNDWSKTGPVRRSHGTGPQPSSGSGCFPRRSGPGTSLSRTSMERELFACASGCFSFLARSCRYASAPDTYRPEHARGAGLHRAPPLATADGFGYFVSLLMVFLALAAPEPPPVPLPFLPEDLLLAAFFAAPSTFLPIPAMSHYLSLAVLLLVFLPTSPGLKHACPGRILSHRLAPSSASKLQGSSGKYCCAVTRLRTVLRAVHLGVAQHQERRLCPGWSHAGIDPGARGPHYRFARSGFGRDFEAPCVEAQILAAGHRREGPRP